MAKENPIIGELNGLFSCKANRITGCCLGFNQYTQFLLSTKRREDGRRAQSVLQRLRLSICVAASWVKPSLELARIGALNTDSAQNKMRNGPHPDYRHRLRTESV